MVAAITGPGHIKSSKTQESVLNAAAWHIENRPGLRSAYKTIYETAPWIRDMFVFQPLVELACGTEGDCGKPPRF